jgi:hypothetical protein
MNSDLPVKIDQRQWEPWKALSVAFGAGMMVVFAIVGAAVWVLLHVQ